MPDKRHTFVTNETPAAKATELSTSPLTKAKTRSNPRRPLEPVAIVLSAIKRGATHGPKELANPVAKAATGAAARPFAAAINAICGTSMLLAYYC